MSSEQYSYGEIEISFFRIRVEGYEVEIRVTDPAPGNQAMMGAVRGFAVFPFEELKAASADPEAYGALLTKAVFADAAILDQFSNARAVFDDRRTDIRLRIAIAESAPKLHGLRWELLKDPRSNTSLGSSERICFSRFPISRDWRSVDLRPKAKLKALIAVAAPTDLKDLDLPDVDAEGEINRALQSLASIECTTLGWNPETKQRQPLTLQLLTEALRAGVDILYLVCHGAMPDASEPVLVLENEQGVSEVTEVHHLTDRIADMKVAPRLVVLASCESAGPAADGNSDAQSALAPRLAEVGVAAVLAMNGRITMQTVEAFMPMFFKELLIDGQIDRALAAARGSVRNHHDFWMPALFMRLKSGRIWYQPGFLGSKSELKTWPSICRKINEGSFIPIIGPSLKDALFGGYRQVAAELAAEFHFPGQNHEASDLAKVTQFLAIDIDRDFAEGEIERRLAAKMVGEPTDAKLSAILDQHAPEIIKDPDDPYRILADLPAKIYVCASPDSTMKSVLTASGKTPEVLAGPWRTSATQVVSQVAPKDPATEPTADLPWVYHVFGSFDTPGSLVLTEDDFFDYLIATSREKPKLIPTKVEGAIIISSLLLLGFRLDDWTFRVFFRMIKALDGVASMQKISHVGVQVDPDTHSFADAAKTREYLTSYFKESRIPGKAEPEIDVYWGSSIDFLKELRDRRAKMPAISAKTGVKPRAY